MTPSCLLLGPCLINIVVLFVAFVPTMERLVVGQPFALSVDWVAYATGSMLDSYLIGLWDRRSSNLPVFSHK